MRRRQKAVSVAMIGLMGALMAAISVISIPTPAVVPITLQIFAASLCGFLLGSAKGAAAVAVYLVLGCLGLPVFSGGGAGFGQLISPTGGFLWSFPVLAAFCGVRAAGGFKVLWPVAGLIVNYIAGILQFATVGSLPIKIIWLIPGVLLIPTFIKDCLLMLAAAFVAKKIKRAVPGLNLLTKGKMCDNVNSNPQK